MNRAWGLAAAAAVVTLLSGCAGTDFVRPDTAQLKLGVTTSADVVKQLGAPRNEGTVLKNNVSVKTSTYAYATTGGKPLNEGVTPARATAFYFADDKLVGHEFLSSFADDNSDFNDKKVPQIIKGKSTRADVTALLGKPGGAYIFPMIDAKTGDAAVYQFQEARGSVFDMKFYRKVLIITFDTAGVVTDVALTTSGTQPTK